MCFSGQARIPVARDWGGGWGTPQAKGQFGPLTGRWCSTLEASLTGSVRGAGSRESNPGPGEGGVH